MVSSDTWRREGKYLFASGKYEDAIKLLNRVLQKYPEDVDAWMFKGRALYYQKKYADALRCYESAIGIDPRNEDCLKEKILCCDKLIEMSAKNADAWDDKVDALMALGRHEEAVEICDKDLGFSLKNAPRAWNWKGDAFRGKGAYEDAIKYYNKTLRQDPDNEDAWMNKGRALYLLGKVAESIKCCDRVIELSPKNAKVWAIKSVAFKALYRYDEAEAAIAKAKELGYRE